MAHFKTFTSLCILLLVLTGCWDNTELPEFSFVQSLAIDVGEDGNILLTTQFYRPSPKIGSQGNQQETNINVQTEGKSIFDAVRMISNILGRRAQWSHMGIILVSDEFLEKHSLGKVLDYFTRDHEPQLLTRVAVVEGKASDLLDLDPYVENTISQQLSEVLQGASLNSAETIDSTIWSVAKQMKSQVELGTLAKLKKGESQDKSVFAKGIFIIQKGKLKGTLDEKQTKMLLILNNQFKKGVMNIPCGSEENDHEVMEILHTQSHIKPRWKNEKLHVDVHVTLDGVVGELKCSTIIKNEDMDKFTNKVKTTILKEAEDLISLSQEEQMDVLEIGKKIHQRQPEDWSKLKSEWNQYYADATFSISAKVAVHHTGDAQGTKLQ